MIIILCNTNHLGDGDCWVCHGVWWLAIPRPHVPFNGGENTISIAHRSFVAWYTLLLITIVGHNAELIIFKLSGLGILLLCVGTHYTSFTYLKLKVQFVGWIIYIGLKIMCVLTYSTPRERRWDCHGDLTCVIRVNKQWYSYQGIKYYGISDTD